MGTLLAVVGTAFGVVGTVLTVLLARRAERLNRERRRLEWPDLQAAASDLSRRILRDFAPGAVFTPGLSGATFTNLLVDQLGDELPVYVGIRFWRENGRLPDSLPGYSPVETNKWRVLVPEALLQGASEPVLIVDDFAMSGDFLEKLRAKLSEGGRDSAQVRSVTVAATNVAIRNHKAPDYYWWTADDDNFYFPWGRAR